MSIIRDLLSKAVERRASDVHIKAGQQPFLRISRTIVPAGFEPLSDKDVSDIVDDIVPPHLQARFKTEHEVDFSLVEPGVGRFRVNVFVAQNVPAIALRHVKSKVPSFDELRLPPQIKQLAYAERGIILLTGTTSSGKSTTLAAILSEISRSRRQRILTVEDPVEYLLDDGESLITQREVGLDTLSYENALRHLLRQDPDVILIGEMRDQTSIRTALVAAETGHLVMSTLHAGTASLAIPRMLDVFPSTEQNQIRMAIAGNVHAIICQRLVPDVDGGMVPAVEILINSPTVRKLLQKNQLEALSSAIEKGQDDGMQTFNQAIYDLIQNGLITVEEGMRHATNPEALRMNLHGIFLDEGRGILAT